MLDLPNRGRRVACGSSDRRTMTVLEMDQVEKSFHDGGASLRILRGISLTLGPSTSIALSGASGSGKSTLLQIAAGLDQPDSGQVLLAGQNPARMPDAALARLRRRRTGFIFQNFNLLPGLSAHDNMLFQRRLNGMPDNDPWLEQLIDTLELADILKRQVELLSGGEQQRVAIARALAHHPDIVFADEPTGNLPDALSQRVMGMLHGLIEKSQSSLLLVTHSRSLAAQTSQQWTLREGRLHAGTHDTA